MRVLVIETATSVCSVALLDDGAVTAAAHEAVGRGHAERLLPMIAALPDGGRADAVLVDCGPGSFTGIRVGLAAARGLGLGWGISVRGYSSLALLAAGHFAATDGGSATVAIEGGHGEIFLQAFANDPVRATGALASVVPLNAAAASQAIIVGSAGPAIVALRGSGSAVERTPDARDAALLPQSLAALPPVPIYGRGADATADGMSAVVMTTGGAADLPDLMAVMNAAFDPRFGEAWTAHQCLGLMAMPGTTLLLARNPFACGFALARVVAGECELMMLGVKPLQQRQGIGTALLDRIAEIARSAGASAMFLEVRAQNLATSLYVSAGFAKVGARPRYYRGSSGEVFDAETYRRALI